MPAIFQQCPSKLTPESIHLWFAGITHLFPSSNTAVNITKNNVLALFKNTSLQANLDSVLKDFTNGHYENEVLGKGKGIPDQMETGFIYVRPCYLSLFTKIFEEGLKGPVLICGDPGIGKSYFGLFVFCRLTGAKKTKAIRFTLSGDWIWFNGSNYQSGHDWNNVSWRDPETWLLLDGSERLEMLSKHSRVILFASPQKLNYNHFMKRTNAVCYYMPEWSLSELESLVRMVQKKDLKDASPFKDLVSRNNNLPEDHLKTPSTENQEDYDKMDRLGVPDDVNPRSLFGINRSEVQSTDSPKDILLSVPSAKGDGKSKPIEEDSDFTKQVLHIVQSRYSLIGGRIRDIFSSGVTTMMLKKKLQLAVRNLDFDELYSVVGLQIESNIPSIIYKIVPDEKDYRLYKVQLCSDRCNQLVGQYLFEHPNRVRVELFYTFSINEDTRGACGNLFEAICFRALSSHTPFQRREMLVLKGKHFAQRSPTPVTLTQISDKSSATPPHTPHTPSEPDNGILQFNDLDIIVKQFDKQCEAINVLKIAYDNYKNCAVNILLLPTFSSLELFDSLVLNVPKKILYLFQITVARENDFDQFKLIKLKNEIEKELCMDLHSLEFGFMVPIAFFPSYGLKQISVRNDQIQDNEVKFTKSWRIKVRVITDLLKQNPKIKLMVVGVDVALGADSDTYRKRRRPGN
jgi:hypothetical protein